MSSKQRPARINVRAVIILLLVMGVLGVGAVGVHHVRKRVMAKQALAAGQAALQGDDLEEACRQLKRYLLQYPDDIEILETYARARLTVRPRTQEHVGAAIGAYRRLLRHKPADDVICDRLIKLYLAGGDYKNAELLCETRLEEDPDDASAGVNLARALVGQYRLEDASRLLEPLIERHPQEVEAYALLADAVLGTDESEGGVWSAEAWLDRCVEHNPQSPLALVQRSRFHRDPLSGRKERDVASALADLERADALKTEKPHVWLDLAHEWVAVGEARRADAILKRIEHVETEVLSAFDLDPDKFVLSWYLIKSVVVRRLGDAAEMSRVATDGLALLSGGYRSAFLGAGIDLYLTAGELEAAGQAIAEYRELLTGVPQGGIHSDEVLSLFAARLAYAKDRPYEVIDVLEPVVARDPGIFVGWRLLGQAYVATKQGRRAIRALEECVMLRPNDKPATMQLVKEYLKQRRWAKALQYARSLSRSALEANLLRIEASLRGAMEQVISSEILERLEAELRDLRQDHPKSAAVRMLLAALADYDNRPDAAIAELSSAIAECSDPLDPAMQLARLFRRLGRLDEAIEVCEAAIKRSVQVARPWIRCAEYLIRAERPEEALAKLQQARSRIEGTQQLRDIEMAMGRLHLRLGEREAAVAKFQEIAAEEPGDVQSRMALLELPEVHGEPGQAQRYVDELKEIEGPRSGVMWRLHQARTWLAGDDWRAHERDIVDVLSHCIAADPDWSRPVLIVGRLYERLDDYGRAEEVYRRLMDVRPDAIDIVDRLLKLLERQNRVAEAKEILDRLPPDLPGLTDHRVGLAAATGEFETAIRELQRLVESDPRDAESRILLARLIYREHRDAQEAFRLLDQAGAIQPDALAVSAVRAFVLLSEDRPEEAKRVLDAAVDQRGDFQAYLLRAQFHIARGEVEMAERDYRRLATFEDAAAAGHEVLGRFYYSQNRPGEAIAAWQRALQDEPDRLSTRRMLMRARLVSEDESERRSGHDMLDDLLSDHPDDADLLAVRARVLLKQGTPQTTREAKSLLERVVALDGRAVSAYLALMQLEFADGNLAAASALISRALGFNPGHTDLLMAQAELERARLNLPQAREMAHLVLEKDPERLAAYVLLTDIAFLSGDLAEAADMIAQAVRRAPQSSIVQLKRAAVLEARGQRPEAIRGLEEFARGESGKNNESVLLALAELCCQEGDFDAFEDWVEKVERAWPDSAGPTGKRVRCLGLQQRFGEIVPVLSQRRAEFPEDTASLIVGANFLLLSGSEQLQREAQQFLEYVVEVDPRSIDGHLGVAQAAYIRGDFERTAEAYRRVLALEPNHNQALNDLAWILAVDDRDLAAAIKLADQGAERYPDDPHLLDTRGVVLTKLGRLAEAERDLRLAVELADARGIRPTHAKALIHLADVHEKQGEAAAARTTLEQARGIDEEFGVLTDQERADINERIGEH